MFRKRRQRHYHDGERDDQESNWTLRQKLLAEQKQGQCRQPEAKHGDVRVIELPREDPDAFEEVLTAASDADLSADAGTPTTDHAEFGAR